MVQISWSIGTPSFRWIPFWFWKQTYTKTITKPCTPQQVEKHVPSLVKSVGVGIVDTRSMFLSFHKGRPPMFLIGLSYRVSPQLIHMEQKTLLSYLDTSKPNKWKDFSQVMALNSDILHSDFLVSFFFFFWHMRWTNNWKNTNIKQLKFQKCDHITTATIP